jgi:hypothetical protein
MHAILNEGKSPRDAITDLMSRTSKSEIHVPVVSPGQSNVQ